MARLFYALVIVFILGFPTSRLIAANPITHPMSVGWQSNQAWFSQHTEHFILHAPENLVEVLPRVAVIAENVHLEVTKALGWSPVDKTHLVITDDVDSANGWATVYPFNQNRIYISAPDAINSLEDYRDWLALLIRHEYTHTAHLDQARGLPAALRSVFGRQALSFPHLFQPLWLIEGLAIDQETDHALGVGRGQSDYYAMQMRAEVERGLVSLGRVSGLNRDWPAGQAYLYGAYFYPFLRETYGEHAVELWLKSYSYNLIPYWMNPTARRVWGEDFSKVWQRYQAWLIARYPVLPASSASSQLLTDLGGRAYSGVLHANYLYRIEADGHSMARLVQQDLTTESVTTLTSVAYPGSFSVSPSGRIVMAQRRANRQNRLYADLWLWDKTRGWQRITDQQRYRQAVWLNDGQLIARRQVAGASELHLLTDKGEVKQVLWQGDAQTQLGSIAIHPSATKLVAMKKPPLGSWQLAEFDLAAQQWQWLTHNNFNHADPSYSVDGRSIVFSANYSSVYQLYQMNLSEASGDHFAHEVAQVLTEVSTGAFQPLLSKSGDLLYQQYSARGYDWALLRLEDQAQRLINIPKADKQAWSSDSSPLQSVDEVTLSAAKPYYPFSSLRPRAWWPVFSFTPERNQFGLMFEGQDALARHHYQLTLAYDDLAQQPFGHLRYQMDNRYLVQFDRGWREGYNQSDLDELILLRARDSFVLGRLNSFNLFNDQFAVHLGWVFEQEQDAWRDRRLAPQPKTQRTDLSLVAHWDNTQSYRYSISPASGWSGYWALDSHDLIDADYSGSRAQFDLKHYLHIVNSQVLHTRLVGGYAQSTAYPFVLGADKGAFSTALFARTDYPLRGYKSASILTEKFALFSLEYRAPLARIQQNWQVYPLGLRDIYGQVFIDSAYANNINFTGLGAQLSVESVIGYRMVLPLNLGVAKGLEKQRGETQFWLSTEWVF